MQSLERIKCSFINGRGGKTDIVRNAKKEGAFDMFRSLYRKFHKNNISSRDGMSFVFFNREGFWEEQVRA